MNRLILLVESRIRGDVYVRFGGELPKTHRSNTAGRWMLSLPPFNQKQWVGVGHWTHTFQLCRQPNLKMEVTAFGQTKSIQGSYDIQPVAFVDAALRYTFAKDKAMLQLKGRDLFNTMNPKTKVRNGAQHLDMNTKSYMQSITLSFSYRFGGYKKKEVKEVDTSRFGN